MAHEFVGEYGGVVKDFDGIDGERRDFREHHTAQRVCSFEVEVLYDEAGALVVGLRATALVLASHRCTETTKRAVYLEEAHVDCAAFWVVVHHVVIGEMCRLCGCGFAGGVEMLRRSRFGTGSDVLAGMCGLALG